MFDNAVALRLLGAHKESTARQRAVRSHEDSEAIIQSINAKLELVRQRRMAAITHQPQEDAAGHDPAQPL